MKKEVKQDKVETQTLNLHPYHEFSVGDVVESRGRLLHWFSLSKRCLPWRGDDPPYSSYNERRSFVALRKPDELKKDSQRRKANIQKSSTSSRQFAEQHIECMTQPFQYRLSAYGTWISEVMLQQTQVSVVIPYWIAWMRKWPTLLKLTQATEDEICHMWAGLGYYQRGLRLLESAKNITLNWLRTKTSSQRSAKQVKKQKIKEENVEVSVSKNGVSSSGLDEMNQENRTRKNLEDVLSFISSKNYDSDWDIPFPRHSVKELIQYKGIGIYTASAILSISFGHALCAIDGNVLRVVSRLLGLAQDVESSKLKRIVEEFTKRWICEHDPGSFNQALMDLGAIVCTPRAPMCEVCPLKDFCIAYKEVCLGPDVNWRKIHHQKNPSLVSCTLCDPSYCNSTSSVTAYPLKKKRHKSSQVEVNPHGINEDITTSCRGLPEKHLALILFFTVNGFPHFLLVKRPAGLLGSQWGPIIVPLYKESSAPNDESLSEADSDRLWQKSTLKLKQTIHEPILEHLHLHHMRFTDLNTMIPFPETTKKKNLPIFQLGQLTHVFSHVTHHVTVLAIPIDRDTLNPVLEENVFLYRWVTISDMSKIDWKSLLVVSSYVKKIMDVFVEAFKTKKVHDVCNETLV